MQSFRLYGKYLKIHFLSGLQYKGWFLMTIQVLFVVITDPIGILFLFSRFGQIGVWSVEKVILIYALAVTSFGLAESFVRGLDIFPWQMIRTGNFDRLLLRPCPLLLQAAGSSFHIHRLSRSFGGLVAAIWCLRLQEVEPTLLNALVITLALCGGFLTYTGVFILTSGLAFFTIRSLDWIYIFTNASYQVAKCPFDYVPRLLRNVFTFFMPMLVVSYYPAAAVCGWGQPYWKGLLALPAGLTFALFAVSIWRIGVRHYQSTGS
ncbi:MAG TPA: hypothetical protein GX739_04960 [Firmicutes bacterium]|nr:hypothetical protein [Bacillota bacterium]